MPRPKASQATDARRTAEIAERTQAQRTALELFVANWRDSSGAERANKDSFLRDLCDAIGVPAPKPTTGDPARDTYVFEKDAPRVLEGGRETTGKIDLYKEGRLILEAKQGSDAGHKKVGTARRGTGAWAVEMNSAYGQALEYAGSFENPPPFIVVSDIGYCFDVYAAFDGSKNYRHFPDAAHHRFYLTDLVDDKAGPYLVETLRKIFTEPHALDPSKNAAEVSVSLAAQLARIAQGLEAAGHPADRIARFLLRCIFTMFAEDVALLPRESFTNSIETKWIPHPENFAGEVAQLWEKMNTGGVLYGAGKIKWFNGGLFKDAEAFALSREQLEILLAASKTDWKNVEPAIFGTLMERAINPKRRHALGAHFTPRAYVERLVRPTIEEPLRAEWATVRADASKLYLDGDEQRACDTIRTFHTKLCSTRILDPACGTGNFLYVSLDLLKRLESEVLGFLKELGDSQYPEATVSPAQFFGIEIEPWAKEIAEIILWIGHIQWYLRTHDEDIPEPVMKEYGNIEHRDALLTCKRREAAIGTHGAPITRWDGETMKINPITGKKVPDEAAQISVELLVGPERALWPDVEFIVGNPPFLGGSRIRHVLGEGYATALHSAWKDVPKSADLVMHWWHAAAGLLHAGKLRRFGFITTNSITQKFSRRVVKAHFAAPNPLSIVYAIPDHPWVDTKDGAAVRVAMTVCAAGESQGVLATVTREEKGDSGEVNVNLDMSHGAIHSDLHIGVDVTGVPALEANHGICTPGMKLHGSGFIIHPNEAEAIGFGRVPELEKHIRQFRNGNDLTDAPRGVLVIDLFGLSADEVRERFPAVYQWILERVKPERDQNKRAVYSNSWWTFGEPRRELRKAIRGLPRYISTIETMERRFFTFLDASVLPDNTLVCIASSDAVMLGVLTSRIHSVWTARSGGTLEDRSKYTKSQCFDPFPFPACTSEQQTRIRDLGEKLDAHRKVRLSEHPTLTMTAMYGVLAKLRAGQEFTTKERKIHEQGLISILRQLHDELDAAVFDAYGWPHDLTDEQILERLVALNAERAEEEKNGFVRWLRPEFQNPEGE